MPSLEPLGARGAAWAGAAVLAAALALWAASAFPLAYVAAYCAFPPASAQGFSAAAVMGTYFAECFPFGLPAALSLMASSGPSLPALAASSATFACPVLAARAFHARIARPPSTLDALPKAARSTEHGTARMVRDPGEIARDWALVPGDAMEVAESGVVLGFLARQSPWRIVWNDVARAFPKLPHLPGSQGDYVVASGDVHVAVFGSTRAGKSRRILIPTIDVLLRSERESALILDPKGELFGSCAEGLRARGVKVNRIDLRHTAHSDCRNPLSEAVALWDRIRKEKDPVRKLEMTAEVSQRVQDLVEMLFPAMPDEGQAKYFNDGARAQIRSAIHYVASSPFCPDEQKTLATVSRVLALYADACPLPQNDKRTFIPYESMLEKLPPDHPAVEAWAAGRGGTAKETAQFASTAQGPLQLYRDPSVMRITQETTTPLDGLGLERSATFLIVPQDRPAYAGFANLFIQQTYSALSDLAAEHGGRLPRNVTIIGEEIGNLPPIPDLAGKLGFGTGLGIRWVLVLQNLAKLQDRYGERPATDMIGNCGVQCLIKTDEIERTAKHFETMLGSYTTTSEGASRSGARLSPFKPQGSESVRTVKRQLLTADELAAWTPDMGNIAVKDGVKYLIPLPDLSETPTQAAFGLGDRDHNQRKQQEALCGGEPRERPLPRPWYPEMKRKRDCSADELRERRSAYLRELGFIHLARFAPGRKGPAEQRAGNGAPLEHHFGRSAERDARTGADVPSDAPIDGIAPDDPEWAGW